MKRHSLPDTYRRCRSPESLARLAATPNVEPVSSLALADARARNRDRAERARNRRGR